jgi:hypothetical protein
MTDKKLDPHEIARLLGAEVVCEIEGKTLLERLAKAMAIYNARQRRVASSDDAPETGESPEDESPPR